MSEIGTGLMWMGLILLLTGMLCFAKSQGLERKLVVTSIMDACALPTFMIGVMMSFGWSMNSLKVFIILIIILIIAPLTSHELARLSKGDVPGDHRARQEQEEK